MCQKLGLTYLTHRPSCCLVGPCSHSSAWTRTHVSPSSRICRIPPHHESCGIRPISFILPGSRCLAPQYVRSLWDLLYHYSWTEFFSYCLRALSMIFFCFCFCFLAPNSWRPLKVLTPNTIRHGPLTSIWVNLSQTRVEVEDSCNPSSLHALLLVHVQWNRVGCFLPILNCGQILPLSQRGCQVQLEA